MNQITLDMSFNILSTVNTVHISRLSSLNLHNHNAFLLFNELNAWHFTPGRSLHGLLKRLNRYMMWFVNLKTALFYAA